MSLFKINKVNILSFKTDNKEFTAIALAIRTSVFVEEQKVDPALEYDEFEDACTHYLLFDNEQPIATARWRETNKGIKLERFAVINSYRNKGIGSEILLRVLDDVVKLNKQIYLNSQLKAVPFYERQGFVAEGCVFLEANIQHQLMTYR